jgi:hypothetical protein
MPEAIGKGKEKVCFESMRLRHFTEAGGIAYGGHRLRHFQCLSDCFYSIKHNSCPHDIPHIDAACVGSCRKSQSPSVAAGASVELVSRES